MLNLPDARQNQIFSYLTYTDLDKTARVSKRFNALSKAALSELAPKMHELLSTMNVPTKYDSNPINQAHSNYVFLHFNREEASNLMLAAAKIGSLPAIMVLHFYGIKPSLIHLQAGLSNNQDEVVRFLFNNYIKNFKDEEKAGLAMLQNNLRAATEYQHRMYKMLKPAEIITSQKYHPTETIQEPPAIPRPPGYYQMESDIAQFMEYVRKRSQKGE